jgi:tetratricopeptide (TPR) repeat protein
MPEAHRHLQQAASRLEASDASAALPSGPGQSLLLFYLGQVQYDLGLIREGQETLRQAQQLNPAEPALPLSLALGDRSLNQQAAYAQHMAQALALVETWLTDHPDDVAALYDRAVIYHAQDLFVDARLDYEAVLGLDPTFYVAYIGLGQSARALGQHAQAEAAFTKAIELAETSGANAAWAYLNLALAYAESGQPHPADEAFRRALLAAPDVKWMYYYYAEFLRQQGEADAALLVYDRLIAVANDKGWAYGEKAEYLKEAGLPQAAILSYLRALHEEPENALFHAYLADLYAEQGEIPAAREHYEKAEAYGSNILYVLLAFAGFLAGQQEYTQAIALYEQALVLEPLNSTALLNLGQAYESGHQPAQALALYAHIIATSDQLPAWAVDIARDRLERLRRPQPA